ncbi:putative thiamine pyrophosphokinase [Xylaria bambusicola]|uniref:putative thiamine pyrophosphokinase n=1 Tax=Xylaria bambusicola TaxID=326684 RepID=UPI0020084664|nr:putative thiamine pyrophosphokinase [Xylaria bambusicola]KAI0515217.1 putative thiamine pyrophosphokinase [Xylaria bambusicola]
MMTFLSVIDTCDNFPQWDPQAPEIWEKATSDLWRFMLPGDNRTFGFLTPTTVSRMPWTADFKLHHSSRTVQLAPETGTDDVVQSSTVAVTKLLQAAQAASSFPRLYNWPGEKYPVLGAPFPFAVDRAIAPCFGIVTTGAQLTVFTRDDNGSIAGIWIAKRAADKPMFPGMLDNAVGGAVMDGETPRESLLREAMEEIGIDVKDATPAGAVSWFNIKDENHLEPGVQSVYDLELEAGTLLRPAETGIEWLRLLSIGEVMDALRRHEFKPSCACVMVDFFVRHGIITAETDRDFPDIVSRLHRRLPFPTKLPPQWSI